MSWIMRDFECECGEMWEDLLDNRDEQESLCPACGSVHTYVVSAVPLASFSLQDKDERRRTMLKRSADNTLQQIKSEPEKHGDIGKKIARETTIRSR